MFIEVPFKNLNFDNQLVYILALDISCKLEPCYTNSTSLKRCRNDFVILLRIIIAYNIRIMLHH